MYLQAFLRLCGSSERQKGSSLSQKRSPGLFKLLDDAGDLWSLSRGRKEGIGGWGLRGLGFRASGFFWVQGLGV